MPTSQILRPRQLFEGRVTTDRANRLVYHVDAAPGADADAPRTVVLDGTWSLTRDHQLALTLREGVRAGRRTIHLRGALEDATANTVVFALRRGEEDDRRVVKRIALSGRWEADAQNRLNFLVQKADGAEDRLTLQGGWELGKSHELTYRYRRLARARRAQEQTLIFRGTWDITRSGWLTYRLAGSTDSAFDFRASLRSPSVFAREGRIVYEIGMGLAQGRTARRRLTLFGTWKLHRDLSVSFEIRYGQGRISSTTFEGTYTVGPRDRITVALRNSRQEELGLAVTFTHQLSRDAELFLRMQRDGAETSAIGGVRLPF
jgi:hypothetical protein